MSKVLLIFLQYLRAFLIIYLCLLTGNFVAAHVPFIIPGSIVGMLLLFLLLASRILPSSWIRVGCLVFTRHMTILFIPASIGIMKYYNVFIDQFGPIVLSCLVSTLIVLLMIGFLTQYLYRPKLSKSDPTNNGGQP